MNDTERIAAARQELSAAALHLDSALDHVSNVTDQPIEFTVGDNIDDARSCIKCALYKLELP